MKTEKGIIWGFFFSKPQIVLLKITIAFFSSYQKNRNRLKCGWVDFIMINWPHFLANIDKRLSRYLLMVQCVARNERDHVFWLGLFKLFYMIIKLAQTFAFPSCNIVPFNPIKFFSLFRSVSLRFLYKKRDKLAISLLQCDIQAERRMSVTILFWNNCHLRMVRNRLAQTDISPKSIKERGSSLNMIFKLNLLKRLSIGLEFSA